LPCAALDTVAERRDRRAQGVAGRFTTS